MIVIVRRERPDPSEQPIGAGKHLCAGDVLSHDEVVPDGWTTFGDRIAKQVRIKDVDEVRTLPNDEHIEITREDTTTSVEPEAPGEEIVLVGVVDEERTEGGR